MSVDTHVPRSATQTLPLSIRDVLFCLGIPILLGHTEIYNVYRCGASMSDECMRLSNQTAHTVRTLRSGTSNEEVVWFNVAIDEILFMDSLYTRQL